MRGERSKVPRRGILRDENFVKILKEGGRKRKKRSEEEDELFLSGLMDYCHFTHMTERGKFEFTPHQFRDFMSRWLAHYGGLIHRREIIDFWREINALSKAGALKQLSFILYLMKKNRVKKLTAIKYIAKRYGMLAITQSVYSSGELEKRGDEKQRTEGKKNNGQNMRKRDC